MAVELREAVVDVLVELHAVAPGRVPDARALGNGFDHRDAMERAVAGDGGRDGTGPYAATAARLVARRRVRLAKLI